MHTGDGDAKSVYLNNTLTALRQPWKWLVVDRELSQGARNLDQQWDNLAKMREQWERTITRDTELELKTAVHDQRSARDTLRC